MSGGTSSMRPDFAADQTLSQSVGELRLNAKDPSSNLVFGMAVSSFQT